MSVETPIADTYRRYLECLNERRWDDLGQFVCTDAIHNGKSLGLSGYREMLEGDVAAIPDLRFDADLVVVQDDVLASRLVFQCTPQRPFLGFEPPGTQVSFTEHVFYRFRDAKIAEVWSAIDTRGVTAQIAR